MCKIAKLRNCKIAKQGQWRQRQDIESKILHHQGIVPLRYTTNFGNVNTNFAPPSSLLAATKLPP